MDAEIAKIGGQLAGKTDTGGASILLWLIVAGLLALLIIPKIVEAVKALRGKTTVSLEPPEVPVKGEISRKREFVTIGEFNTRMGKVEDDIKDIRSDVTAGNAAVIKAIEELDRKDEARICAVNRRLDPIVEKVAANSATIEFMKAAALKATVGGKK